MCKATDELFIRALELPPDRHSAFLDEIEDAGVRAEVASLLGIDAAYPEPATIDVDGTGHTDADESYPQRVGDFELERMLGSGGTGRVFLSTDPELGRPCAVKLLRTDRRHDPERCARFKNEAQILASMNHPNIAAVYRLGEDGGQPYFVMEYLPGGSLRERLRQGPLSVDESRTICLQAAEALTAAHAAGIVHRDLKPSNVMMTDRDTVKLVDFGLARSSPIEISAAGPRPPEGLTGSLGYASPEQMQGAPPDPGSDAWSFGCVLFECLAGEPAFPGESGLARWHAVSEGQPDWDALPEDVPESLRTLLERLLTRDPAERLSDFRIITRALRSETLELTSVTGEDGVSTPPTPPPSTLRRVASWAIPLAAAIAIIGFLVIYDDIVRHDSMIEQQLTFSGETRHVAISPDGEQIAIVTTDGTLEIMDADSREQTVVCTMASISRPTWSGDGRELFFIGNPDAGGEGPRTFVVDRGSTDYEAVGPPGFRGPSPSPDGTRLAGYKVTDGSLPTLGILDRSTGGFTPLQVTPVFSSPPKLLWSPIADLLLITGNERGRSGTALWLHSLVSGLGVRLLERPTIFAPTWSPDGRAVVYREDETLQALSLDPDTGLPVQRPRTIVDRFEGRGFSLAGTATDLQIAYYRGYNSVNLWVADATSNKWVEHSEWRRLTRGTHQDRHCRLDASGEKVVVARSKGMSQDLYLIDVETGEESRITHSGTRKSWPTWSPDGTRVAYSETGDGIRLLDVETQTAVQLANDPHATYVYWPRRGPIFFQRSVDRNINYRLLDPVDRTETTLLSSLTGGTMFQAGILPDASAIAVAGNRGFGDDVRVWLFDRESGSEELVYDGWAAPFAWCPKGKWLYMITDDPAFDTEDGSVILGLDVKTGAVERLIQCPGEASGWSSISMSDDCRRVVCAIKDMQLDAWLMKGVSL